MILLNCTQCGVVLTTANDAFKKTHPNWCSECYTKDTGFRPFNRKDRTHDEGED